MKTRLIDLGYKSASIVFAPVTYVIHFLVGDYWHSRNFDDFVNTLSDEADKTKKGIAVRSMGVFAGNFSVFVPKSASQLR